MRTSINAISLLLIICAAGCSDLDNVEVKTTATTVIPARTLVDELLGQLAFAGFEGLSLSESREFRNQGYTKDDIDNVRVKSFTMTIAAPSGGNFDWLERIAFSASAGELPDVEIARLDPVPDGLSRLELHVAPGVELAPYATAEAMTITTSASGIRPPEETTVEATVILDIDINVSGSL